MYLYKHSNVTAFEIVYFQCVAMTLSQFAALLVKGVYILDLEGHLRFSVILRGFLYFAALLSLLLGI